MTSSASPTPLPKLNPDLPFYHAPSTIVSLKGYQAIVWTGFSLCLLIYTSRIHIRLLTSGRPLLEDYLMFIALIIQLIGAIFCQLYMHFAYTAEAINNSWRPIGSPSESSAIVAGIRKIAVGQVLYIFGIYFVKANFLFFFHRLGDKIRLYKIMWWIVAVFTLCTGVVWVGTVPYRCVFASKEYMATGKCNLHDGVQMRRAPILASSILDALSDTAIMVLPIVIVWNVRLTRRQRMALTALFAMSLFTIAVIIVRASVFFKDRPRRRPTPINLSWTWFWTVMEFYVSFMIACLMSFRNLFVHRGNTQSVMGWHGRSSSTPRRGDTRDDTPIPQKRRFESEEDALRLVPKGGLNRSNDSVAREMVGGPVQVELRPLEPPYQRPR
ncbi:hypothetical protein QBC38DRAFT_486242 [Podospora fimiseda]|uniref:Rhodopsin domain-containing protein n=1 Tax=Podospora fimiseda TaxID=252190 RepID=A0AAN7BIL7_9PEZI|nr:hypothetical protein QBC38DRAFT_486242 [Podospora fimiseda]